MKDDLLEKLLGAAAFEGATGPGQVDRLAAALRERAALILAERVQPIAERAEAFEKESAWRGRLVEGLQQEKVALLGERDLLGRENERAKEAHAALLSDKDALEKLAREEHDAFVAEKRALEADRDRLRAEIARQQAEVTLLQTEKRAASEAHDRLLAHHRAVLSRVTEDLTPLPALRPWQYAYLRTRIGEILALLRKELGVISAIVPTFHGQARLDRNLPSVVASLAAAGEPWEIIVVDDGGGGIATGTAGTRVLESPENRGYGPAVNAGVAEARGDFFLILNDDVRLEEETVARLRRLFPSPDLFAAVPRIVSRLATCGDEGGKAAEWSAGLLEIRERPAADPHPTLYPVGCCFLCPREQWQVLRGYDEVFAPFFWEDVDLGYRAWRAGAAILHVPDAVCHHEGSSTLDAESTLAARETIGFRNRALFHLRNLRDPELRAECYGALAAYALFEPRAERQEGLGQALALFARAGRRDEGGLTDRAVLEKVRAR